MGDGFLYLQNPFSGACARLRWRPAFASRWRTRGAYYGFPLIHLDTQLSSRKIPYRPSFTALEHLEQRRPGFFTLADLQGNRPAPNYLLHESAHAAGVCGLVRSRPRDVAAALSEPSALVKLMLGESFAMTAEYFAACAVRGQPHAWFFSEARTGTARKEEKPWVSCWSATAFRSSDARCCWRFCTTTSSSTGLDRRQLAALADAADPRVGATAEPGRAASPRRHP